MAQRRVFGALPDGRTVEEVTLRGGGLTAKVIAWGAVVRDLRLDGRGHPLVLGLDRLGDYIDHSPHFGAIAGRCANRVAHGRFTLDGQARQLELKPGAAHHLHGGAGESQFGRRAWTIADLSDDAVLLTLVSADGEGGYPGRVEVSCRYALDDGALSVTLIATTDAPTLVNLAQHSYFNLDGAPDVKAHRLQIVADRYTPTADDLIPNGELRAVEGTPYDFRAGRLVGAPDAPPLYDANFCIAEARSAEPRLAARLTGATGLAMEVHTTEPGVQFFNAPGMNIPVPGLDGRRYGASAGLCLEPQVWPDAINHPGWPSPVLRPGETYRQVSVFRFAET